MRALPRSVAQLLALKEQILEFDRMILAWHRSNQTSKRLHYIPGSARCWRLRWLRVLPIPEPSGQGVTSPPGLGSFPNSTQVEARSGSAASVNREIAICAACSWPGALAVIRYAKIHGTGHRPWLTALLGRRPTKVAAIALANKIARMAWAMMAKGERYKQPAALAR